MNRFFIRIILFMRAVNKSIDALLMLLLLYVLCFVLNHMRTHAVAITIGEERACYVYKPRTNRL